MPFPDYPLQKPTKIPSHNGHGVEELSRRTGTVEGLRWEERGGGTSRRKTTIVMVKKLEIVVSWCVWRGRGGGGERRDNSKASGRLIITYKVKRCAH